MKANNKNAELKMIRYIKAKEGKPNGVYDLGFGREVVVNTPPDEMTLRIAKALEEAAEIRESSYDNQAANIAEKKGTVVDFSKFYQKDIKEASYEACVNNKLDPHLYFLLYLLLDSYWNDVSCWSKDMYERT